MSHKVLSVTQLNDYLARKLDADPLLGAIAVRGEISNHNVSGLCFILKISSGKRHAGNCNG